MQVKGQFPALGGKDALPALGKPMKNPPMKNMPMNKGTHPLGKTPMKHPLAPGGKC